MYNLYENISTYLQEEIYYQMIEKEPNDVFKMDLDNPRILFHVMQSANDKIIKDKFSEDEFVKLKNICDDKLKSEEMRLGFVYEMMRYSFASTSFNDWNLDKRFENNPKANQDLKEFAVPVLMAIEELLDEQKKKFSDIYQYGHGAYSYVYRIGDRILKLGTPREKYKIKNSDKILQPIVRRKLKTDEFAGFIEIMPRVKLIDKDPNIVDEELYQFWREVFQDRNRWTDPSYCNVGYLLEDNVTKLDDKPLYVDPESVGLIGEIKTIRKKGKMVIIDSDYLYDLEDLDIEIGRESNYHYCCERYKKEMSKKIFKPILNFKKGLKKVLKPKSIPKTRHKEEEKEFSER